MTEGANVLAVEIHQSAANSSDISFDLELTGERPLMPIALNVPAHGATGVGLLPALDVSVSHREGLPMTVTFVGRPAPPVGPAVTVVALPDKQFYSSSLNDGKPPAVGRRVSMSTCELERGVARQEFRVIVVSSESFRIKHCRIRSPVGASCPPRSAGLRPGRY